MYVKPKIVAYIGGFFVLYKTQSNHLLRLVSLLYEIHFYSKQVIKYYFFLFYLYCSSIRVKNSNNL